MNLHLLTHTHTHYKLQQCTVEPAVYTLHYVNMKVTYVINKEWTGSWGSVEANRDSSSFSFLPLGPVAVYSRQHWKTFYTANLRTTIWLIAHVETKTIKAYQTLFTCGNPEQETLSHLNLCFSSPTLLLSLLLTLKPRLLLLTLNKRDGYITYCIYSLEQVIKQSGWHTHGQLA